MTVKKLITLTILAFVVGLGYSQKLKQSEVPNAVRSAFAKAYPAVKEVKWARENESFEAGFHLNKKETSVVLNATGQILEEEVEMTKRELPKTILDALSRDFAKYKIEEVAKIMAQGVVTYETEVELGQVSFDLIFDGKGKLLKKVDKEEKERD